MILWLLSNIMTILATCASSVVHFYTETEQFRRCECQTEYENRITFMTSINETCPAAYMSSDCFPYHHSVNLDCIDTSLWLAIWRLSLNGQAMLNIITAMVVWKSRHLPNLLSLVCCTSTILVSYMNHKWLEMVGELMVFVQTYTILGYGIYSKLKIVWADVFSVCFSFSEEIYTPGNKQLHSVFQIFYYKLVRRNLCTEHILKAQRLFYLPMCYRVRPKGETAIRQSLQSAALPRNPAQSECASQGNWVHSVTTLCNLTHSAMLGCVGLGSFQVTVVFEKFTANEALRCISLHPITILYLIALPCNPGLVECAGALLLVKLKHS